MGTGVCLFLVPKLRVGNVIASLRDGTDHGISMHQEMRLLVQAGLTNEQALASATSIPAMHFNLADRGQIAPGMRADLILVDGDPTKDVANVARIVGVWKGGFPIDRTARIDSVKAEKVAAMKRPTSGKNKLVSDFEGKNVTARLPAFDPIYQGRQRMEAIRVQAVRLRWLRWNRCAWLLVRQGDRRRLQVLARSCSARTLAFTDQCAELILTSGDMKKPDLSYFRQNVLSRLNLH